MTILSVEAILIWLIVGILAGYIVGEILPAYGFGLEGNILVGLLGGLIGGVLSPQVHWFPGANIRQLSRFGDAGCHPASFYHPVYSLEALVANRPCPS